MSKLTRCDRCKREDGLFWDVAAVAIQDPQSQHISPTRYDLCNGCKNAIDHDIHSFSLAKEQISARF